MKLLAGSERRMADTVVWSAPPGAIEARAREDRFVGGLVGESTVLQQSSTANGARAHWVIRLRVPLDGPIGVQRPGITLNKVAGTWQIKDPTRARAALLSTCQILSQYAAHAAKAQEQHPKMTWYHGTHLACTGPLTLFLAARARSSFLIASR